MAAYCAANRDARMSFPRTKIQPPRPRPDFVPRGAVQARLAQALTTKPVVLLCAPAGYGKTTLLAETIARLGTGYAIVWVAVDSGDDLSRLLDCIVAALEPYDPPWRIAPEALGAQASRGASDEQRRIAAEIINALDACEVAHGAIVLDDVHRTGDAVVFAFLDLLIERMSPRWTVAITSREDPPLALARLRARDDLAEFRQVHLQFARDEARHLASASGIDDALADRLFDRTQGWPAGLRIAVGAASTNAAASAQPDAVLRTVERPLFDFLVAEVLGQLRPELARFLLDTSVLPELDSTRCALLTGDEHAVRRLDEIERLGLFVDVLEGPTRTLRLHDLFREALQQRLAIEAPKRLAELRRRASESEPDAIRRIGYLLAAGELEAAANLAAEHLPLRMPVSGPQPASHMLAQFPQAFRDRSPALTFVAGLTAYLRWDFEPMFVLMERAERGLVASGDTDRALHARAIRGNALMALGRIDEADALLASLSDTEMSIGTRIVLRNAQAWLALETGRGAAVGPIVSDMLTLLEQAGRLDLWYQTTPPTRFPGLRGMARPLARHAELLLRVAGDEPTPLRAIALLLQGWGALWEGRLAQVRECEERAEADAAWTGMTAAVRGHLMALRAFRLAIVGDADAAIALARRRVAELAGGYRDWGHYLLWGYAAHVMAICGDAAGLGEALARIDEARLRAGLDLAVTPPLVAPLLALRAWLEGRSDEAIARWRAALEDEDAIDVHGQLQETRVRLAHALAQRGDIDGAARLLAAALARATEDAGPGGALFAPAALRALAVERRLDAAVRTRIGDWLGLIEQVARPAVDATAASASAETRTPLTQRELEVLAHIAAGDSNKHIARALDLSLHTVKRHVANILDKLDLASRGQAADWFRTHRA